jgi:hypothetical protein
MNGCLSIKNKKVDLISILILSVSILLMALITSVPVYSQRGNGAEPELQKAMGQDYNLRPQTYQGLTLVPEAWRVGDIISAKPYAVVTGKSTQGETSIRVWTGLLSRNKDDLTSTWDELWVDPNGAVTNAHAELEEVLPGYFRASSHESYLVREYVGRMPWVRIPTDAEAQENSLQPVPAERLVNYYQIRFTEWEPVVADNSALSIGESGDMPDSVPLIPSFAADSAVSIPADVAGHWAETYMMDLLQKQIVNGYEDHTLRPQLSVTRSEFVALLVRSTGKGGFQQSTSGYQDVDGHWASPWIGAAQSVSFLEVKPQTLSFRPDDPITRMEMAELVTRACDTFQLPASQEAPGGFTDTGGLTPLRQEQLAKAVGAGLIGGYPDGTFRPESTLTRAEAFKVLSGLISLLLQEGGDRI